MCERMSNKDLVDKIRERTAIIIDERSRLKNFNDLIGLQKKLGGNGVLDATPTATTTTSTSTATNSSIAATITAHKKTSLLDVNLNDLEALKKIGIRSTRG